MSLLINSYRPDHSTASAYTQDDYVSHKSDSWSLGGEAASVREGFNQALGWAGGQYLLANSVVSAPIDALFGTNWQEQNLERAQVQFDYWNNRARNYQANTIVGKSLTGLANMGGSFITGGGVGVVTNTLIGETATALGDGKDLQTAQGIGATRAATMGVSLALPFSAPLLRGTTSAYSAFAQRLGYGIASNAGVGMIGRGVESTVLRSGGYEKEAAQVRWNDTEALAVDVVLGMAFGAGAGWMKRAEIQRGQQAAEAVDITPEQAVQPKADPVADRRAQISELKRGLDPEASENFIRGKVSELEVLSSQRLKSADVAAIGNKIDEINGRVSGMTDQVLQPARVREIADQIKADNPQKPARQVKAEAEQKAHQELAQSNAQIALERSKLQTEAAALTGKLEAHRGGIDAASRLNAMQDQISRARTVEEKAMAAGATEAQAKRMAAEASAAENLAMEEMAYTLTPEHLDAALYKNLDLKLEDSALGRPKTESALIANKNQIAEAISAIREGREMNLIIRPDQFEPVSSAQLMRTADGIRAAAKELTPIYNDAVDLHNAKPMELPATLPDDAAHTSQMIQNHEAMMANLTDDMPVSVDGVEGVKTMADFKKYQKTLIDEANDMADTVKNAFACLIGM
jgi:hypothetical protein